MNLFRDTFGSANYLIAFEAAVRLGSYTKAAAELNVTQPAVSRQVRELENYLGFNLFYKQNGKTVLTTGGKNLYLSVSTHFNEILKEALRGRQISRQRVILIHTVVVAATHWLFPALPQFHASHPGIRLRIVASDDLVGAEDGIDIAVQFGKGDWPGKWSHKLLDEVIFPVCTPCLMKKLGNPRTINDLQHVPLLQLEENKGPWLDWRNWLSRFSTAQTEPIDMVMMSNYTVLLHAAVRGQGVALGWQYMAAEDLQAGRLVPVLDFGVSSEYGEFLVVSPTQLKDPDVRVACAWLLRHARKTYWDYKSLTPNNVIDVAQITPDFPARM